MGVPPSVMLAVALILALVLVLAFAFALTFALALVLTLVFGLGLGTPSFLTPDSEFEGFLVKILTGEDSFIEFEFEMSLYTPVAVIRYAFRSGWIRHC